ncbi:hypothetical protein [Poriferisphaera corsica]|nr:hypothetical protein [Poriferisphaera corsica]
MNIASAKYSCLAILILMSLGCVNKGTDNTNTALDNRSDESFVWQSKPVAIRIYPSTRFRKSENQIVLETRVELFDEMGDSVKGAGMFAFELLEAVSSTSGGAGTQLYTWNAELLTLESQRQHYDPISRGYLFQLKMHDQQIAQQGAVLRVVYSPHTGKRFSSEMQILPH